MAKYGSGIYTGVLYNLLKCGPVKYEDAINEIMKVIPPEKAHRRWIRHREGENKRAGNNPPSIYRDATYSGGRMMAKQCIVNGIMLRKIKSVNGMLFLVSD